MKVALLGNYPTYPFAEILKVKYEGRKVATWLINLAKYLSKDENVELHVISEDEYLPKDYHFISDNINFHFLKCPKRFKAATLFVGNVIRINKLLKQIKPDIINAHHTDEYALASIKATFPYVITIHGIYSRLIPNDNFISRAKIVSMIEKYILKKAKNLIATSPFVYEAVGNSPTAKFYDIENCLDEKYFVQNKDYSINYNLLFIGHIIEDKGAYYILEAINKLKTEFPKIKLNIIGNFSVYEESYRNKFLEFIAINGISNFVNFLGFLREEEKIHIINNTTILIHPSRLETFGMAIAEATATGTPIIASRVGGIPYTIGGKGNAILVEFKNVDQIIMNIRKLFLDQDLRITLGTNAKSEAFRRFHPSVIITETIDCYKDIIKNNKVSNG